jgi:hypothetical protein
MKAGMLPFTTNPFSYSFVQNLMWEHKNWAAIVFLEEVCNLFTKVEKTLLKTHKIKNIYFVMPIKDQLV